MPLANPMQSTDMMHRNVLIPSQPKRIVSLVPSISETLYELRLEDRVVGITKFCIYPEEWFSSKTKVGGTKKVNIAIIDDLAPDLIIANREENSKEDIDLLAKKYPVWVSDISNFDEGLHAIELIGEICHAEKEAKKILYRIHKAWSEFTPFSDPENTCLYFIWNDPMMVAGSGTYIGDIIKRFGMRNCCIDARYPELDADEAVKLNPSYVFLSSEPYPFKKKHLAQYQKLFPKAKILFVDGEVFSWYGIRMRYTPSYFQKLIFRISNK